jgi:Leucine-rich repeat (LRR) protein
MASLDRFCFAWHCTASVIVAAAVLQLGEVMAYGQDVPKLKLAFENMPRKRFNAGKNNIGQIVDLFCDSPTKAELNNLATEDFDLKRLHLIKADIGASALLTKLTCSPKLKFLDLRECDLTQVKTFVDGQAQQERSWVSLSRCNISQSTLRDLGTLNQTWCITIGKPNYPPEEMLDYSVLRTCSSLTEIWISDRRFKDCSWLSDCKNLKNLNFPDSGIDDAALVQFGSLPKLERLHIIGAAVTDKGLSELRCASLHYLTVGSSLVSPQGIRACLQQNEIESLTLSGIKEDFDLSKIAVFPRLRRLVVERAADQSRALLTIPQDSAIKALGATHCEIDPEVFAHLGKLKSLEEVDVGSSNATFEDLVTIATNPSVTRIECFDGGLGNDGDLAARISAAVGRPIRIGFFDPVVLPASKK